MAIFHFHAKIISRGKGQSAVASAAYQSAESLYSEDDELTKNFSRKEDVLYKEILLPPNAEKISFLHDREKLWNYVEAEEKNPKAQLARAFDIALPAELSQEQQLILAKKFIQEELVARGMIVDFALHRSKDGTNPHIHIMTPMREIMPNGKFAPKAKKVFVYDKKGNRIPILDENKQQKKEANGKLQWRTKKIFSNDWGTKENLIKIRKSWADLTNAALLEAGFSVTIDHRSNEERGIPDLPTIHEGAAARGIERRGGISDRCEENRRIRQYNASRRRRTTPRRLKNDIVDKIPYLFAGAKLGKEQKKASKRYIEEVTASLLEAEQSREATAVGHLWQKLSRLASTHSPMIRQKSLEDIARLSRKLAEPAQNDEVEIHPPAVDMGQADNNKSWLLMNDMEREAEIFKKEMQKFVYGNGL